METSQVVKNDVQFIGHAWQDSYVDKKSGQTKQRVSVSLDQNIKEFVWKAGDRLTLFENPNQREGKRDAQWRVVLSPSLKK